MIYVISWSANRFCIIIFSVLDMLRSHMARGNNEYFWSEYEWWVYFIDPSPLLYAIPDWASEKFKWLCLLDSIYFEEKTFILESILRSQLGNSIVDRHITSSLWNITDTQTDLSSIRRMASILIEFYYLNIFFK